MLGEGLPAELLAVCSNATFLSPALRMQSAVANSSVCGASAAKMQPRERPEALVNTRLTAAQTSAVLSITVCSTACVYQSLPTPPQRTYLCFCFVW